MKRKILFSFILFMILCISVSAKENKLYFKESDNSIYYNSSQLDKKSFMYHDDMVPGSSYIDELVIENGTNRTYTLFFKINSSEQSEEAEELLDNISMKIYLDEELIYEGKVKGLDYTEEGIDLQEVIKLKEFEPNEKSIMRVETELSKEYSNKNLEESSYIDWTFYAQYDIPEEIIGVPDTHKSNLPITIISIVTCLIGLSVVVYAHKKEN